VTADLGMQLFGIGCIALALGLTLIGLRLCAVRKEGKSKLRCDGRCRAVSAPLDLRRPCLPPNVGRSCRLGGALGDALLGFTAFIGMGSLGLGPAGRRRTFWRPDDYLLQPPDARRRPDRTLASLSLRMKPIG